LCAVVNHAQLLLIKIGSVVGSDNLLLALHYFNLQTAEPSLRAIWKWWGRGCQLSMSV